MQDDGEIVARRGEARRKLEAAFEQILRIAIAAEARRDLGEHPDRRDIGRVLPEMGAEQCLGRRDAVFAQRDRRLQQSRIAGRRLQVLRVGRVGTLVITKGRQVIGQRTPGVGQVRVESDSAPECGDGGIAVARRALGEAEQQQRLRLLRHDGEDLAGLFRGQMRGAREELPGMCQCDLDGAGRLAGRHAFSPGCVAWRARQRCSR